MQEASREQDRDRFIRDGGKETGRQVSLRIGRGDGDCRSGD